jgi:hypothetical protein
MTTRAVGLYMSKLALDKKDTWTVTRGGGFRLFIVCGQVGQGEQILVLTVQSHIDFIN